MSTRWLHTLRTAISALVVAWLNMAFHFGDPFWGIVTVFLLSLAYAEATFARCLLWMLSTVIGGYVGLGFFAITANSNLLTLLGSFILTVIGAYKVMTGKYPFAWIFGVGNFYFMGITVITDPSAGWSTMVWRDVQTILSITILLLFSFVFMGRRATSVAPALMAQLAKCQADLYRSLIEAITHGRDKNALLPEVRSMRGCLRRLDQVAALALNARHFKGLRGEVLNKALLLYRDIVAQLEHLELNYRYGLVPPADQIAKLELPALVAELGPLIEQAVPLHSVVAVSFGPVEKQIKRSQVAFEELRIQHRALQDTGAENLVSHSILSCSRIILDLVHQLYLLQNLRPSDLLREKGRRIENKPWSSKLLVTPKGIARARSLRTGLTAVIAIFVVLWSGWPYARMGVVAAIMVGMEREVHFTWLRALQRLLGTVSGVVLGVSVLAFFIDDVLSFCFVFFLTCLLPAYLAAGPPKTSAVGAWMGLALGFSITQSDVLSPSVAFPMQAVGGIMIGSVVGLGVSLLTRTKSPRRVLDEGIGQVFAAMANLLHYFSQASTDEEELEAIKFRLISYHNFNTDVTDGIKDAWREKTWQYETRAILQVLALTRGARFEEARQPLAGHIDMQDYFADLGVRFADVGLKLISGQPFTAATADLAAKMKLLDEQVETMRIEGTLLELEPHAASSAVFVVSALLDLYKVINELAAHQVSHPPQFKRARPQQLAALT